MTTLSDLQKKLEQESQGIMFPFSANASTINTTQNVYNSATDGIMTMQGKQYVGPDSVVQYGSEKQGYPRQLKQIEAPMLPQFDAQQFPKAGEGIIKAPSSAPIPTPSVETKPETPVVNPCPPGYQLVNGVCQLIQQQDDNKGNIKGIPITNGIIEGYEGLSDMRRGPAFYNTLTDSEKLDYNKAISFGRGIQYKTLEDGTKKIIAKSPTFSQALAEMAPFALIVDAVKNLAEKVFGKEVFKKEEITESRPTLPSTGSNITGQGGDFGKLVTIDTKDSQTGETIGTVNKRFTDNITTGHFRLSNTLATIANLQKRIKNVPRGGNINKLIETAKNVAEKEFNETIQEDKNKGNNSLSKSQRDYLDSNNRRALPGETKSANGKDVDNRKDFVSGRENEGYGFRSTSANYNKSTKTFDQRFK